MPQYEIAQYEIHECIYRVTAASEAEAIQMVLDGEAEEIPLRGSYIETAEDLGMPTDEYPELTEELHKLGTPCRGIIPSIRSIEEV